MVEQNKENKDGLLRGLIRRAPVGFLAGEATQVSNNVSNRHTRAAYIHR